MSGEGTEFPSPPSRRAPPGWSAEAPYSGGGYVQHTKRCQATRHVRAVGRASGSGADWGGKGYEFFGAKFASQGDEHTAQGVGQGQGSGEARATGYSWSPKLALLALGGGGGEGSFPHAAARQCLFG